eukprot:TRINITY_DN10285_c0_g1_i1.p1 TRINITY_DN10285_c0_g1~~TRINITY_DN10285_c0_g1_i1.p1  ORF type:complete len:453 (-),score=128.60 TRINITY_DN10285_c0_g1_i1:31-1389(-)
MSNIDSSNDNLENESNDDEQKVEVKTTTDGSSNGQKKKNIEDYTLEHILGEGSFGDVYLAVENATGKKYAIKQMLKLKMANKKNSKIVMNERNVLAKCSHPGIVKLSAAFRDADYFYYVITYAENGELLRIIQKNKGLSLDCVRFLVAELVVILEYLHCEVGVIHRDLKPENILISDRGHVLLTDFGTSKLVDFEEGRVPTRGSFVGTAEYVAPELIQDTLSCFSMDLWSLGCTVYQMITGRPPFRGANQFLTMNKVQEGFDAITWPEPFPEDAKDLIYHLLQKNPDDRLGATSYEDLKTHPFFQGIDFNSLYQMDPPGINPPEIDFVWEEDVIKEEQERAKKENDKVRRKWERFLDEDEDIVHTGVIIKTRKLSKKKRMLILTNKPRLFYVDAKKMVVKGEIPWSNSIQVQVRNEVVFKISVTGRTYDLEDLKNDAQRWKQVIEGLKKDDK